MLKRYNAYEKSIITSFDYEALKEARAYDSEVKLGWLYVRHNEKTIEKLRAIKALQGCPKACEIKPEHLSELYSNGFECRAWGISDVDIMKRAVDMGVNAGMTVNFPDKLVEYMKTNSPCDSI